MRPSSRFLIQRRKLSIGRGPCAEEWAEGLLRLAKESFDVCVTLRRQGRPLWLSSKASTKTTPTVCGSCAAYFKLCTQD
jgi:hypothetical protein